MQDLKGKILISSPTMDDEKFKDTMIFIVEHNNDGAIGFVINQLFDKTLNNLVEFSNSRPFPLYYGGPVDNEHIFFIHCNTAIIQEGTFVIDNIFYSGNFKQVIEGINQKTLSTMDIKLLIGYCGWNTLELEQEIEEGSWIVIPSTIEMVFAQNPALFL